MNGQTRRGLKTGIGWYMQQADDYIKEVEALADLLSGQPDDVFQLETLFKSWTVNDVIGHLHMFDIAALAALESDAAFDAFFAPIQANLSQGFNVVAMSISVSRSVKRDWVISKMARHGAGGQRCLSLSRPQAKGEMGWARNERTILHNGPANGNLGAWTGGF
jgi:hypothetical protein